MNTTLERTAWAGLAAANCSAFLRESIEKKLKELRDDCALKRLIKSNAFGRRWARSARSDEENRRDSGSSDKYWDDRQAEAQRNSTAELEAADKALANFIAEHRPLMGADWIGNDHGRLCWAPYCGGRPIDQYYCQKEEGHEGPHAAQVGEDGGAAGEWPQNVTNEHEWHRLLETLPKGATGLERQNIVLDRAVAKEK
ncbi:MAG TPA: hypothetical protein VHG89_03775 [Verrucomicrobiae bacterium]|nr:hypothetical protein [Verrucomicrobiae bacterium]